MINAGMRSVGLASAVLGAVVIAAVSGGCGSSTNGSGGETSATGGAGGVAATSSSSSGGGATTTSSSSSSSGATTTTTSSSSSSSSGGGATTTSSSSSSSSGTGGAAGDASLLLHYTFDEGSGLAAHDASGNHHDGTLQGSAAWIGEGHIGGALVLAGADPHVALPANLLDAYDTVTIATWIKMTSLTPWARVFDFGGSAGAFMYLVPQDGAGLMHLSVFKAATPSNREAIVTSSSLLPAGVWQHLAIKVSPTSGYQMWLNGNLVAFTAFTAPNDVKPSELAPTPSNWIGKSQFEADAYLQAQLDDFRIYTRALGDDEIATLAAQ
ncbi:Poly(3-hydroxyalkanoate) depolymerase [Minicystis rosea]|nr:Poly(3-hydroxyalkanoate) depolymerase [Minicystis rosea]